MPIRLGDVIVLLLLAIALRLFLTRGKATRVTATREAPQVIEEAEVVEVHASRGSSPQSPPPPAPAAEVPDEHVTTVNVRGRGASFRCEERRRDSTIETHVYQINARGERLTPSRIYKEPLQHVVDDLLRAGW
jgi:hypothetical protein